MITKELFCEVMQIIKDQTELNNKNSKVLENMFQSYIMFHEVTPMVDQTIQVLMKLSHDKSKWIEWYIYETDFGKNNTSIIEVDAKKEIKVNSFEVLYDLIKGTIYNEEK